MNPLWKFDSTQPVDGNNPLIFIHIPKTAGSTFHFILSREYKGRGSYWLPANNAGSGEKYLEKMPEERRSAIRLLRGHMYFGLDHYLCDSPDYITFLRNPVSRVLSYYQHMKSEAQVHGESAGWWYEAARRNLSLPDYYGLYRDKMIDNDQVRRISGVDFNYGECTQEHLEKARQHLLDKFAFVGITERFDASILAMRKQFAWRTTPYYLREKVVADRNHIESNDALLNEVRNRNHYDIKLYHYAEALFLRKIDACGSSFSTDLRRFQKQNQYVSRLLHIVLPGYRRIASRF